MISEIIIEKPTVDLWNKSLKEILDSIPGDHSNLVPVSIVNRYFFDYSFFDNDFMEQLAEKDGELKTKLKAKLGIKEKDSGIYHWSDKDLKSLERRVRRALGPEFVQYIEPKLVLICESKQDKNIIKDLFSN